MDCHRRQTAVNAFYIEGGRLSPEDARHAAKVLRLRPGDEIVALDGMGGRSRARLGEDGSVELLETLPSNEPRLRLTVYHGVPKADKLLCSKIDVGEDSPRTVVSGIAAYYSPEQMIGKRVVVVTNLKPVKLRGILSEGMILCAEGADGKLSVVSPEGEIAPGGEVR